MFQLAKLLSVAAVASSAVAHFTLDYPPTRGFDEDLEPNFCGGFPVANNRSLFPITGGMVEIDSHHTSSVFVTLISFSQNPQNFSDFSIAPDGQSIPYLKPFIQLQGTGEMCVPVDIASLGINGVTNGTNATIMVQFNGGDGELYQCSDVTLTTASVQPLSCTNTSTFVAVESSNTTSQLFSTSASSAPSATATKSDASRLTPVAGLAFIAALLACLL